MWLATLCALACPAGVGAATITYVYDALGRLVAVIDDPGATNDVAIYRYDAVGNLTSIVRQSASVTSVIDVSPGTGPVGSTVTISGTGFSASPSQNTVTIDGVAATVMSATPHQLVVTVPAGAATGTVVAM